MKLDLPEVIATQRLSLRRLRYEDAEEIFYTYASKPEATRFVSWPTHRRIEDTITFLHYGINAWDRGTDYTYTVRLRENNRLIGSIGLMHDQGKVQFGYIFSPTQWNNGFATETCRAVLQYLKQNPQVFKIETVVDVENRASVKVLIKSGLVEKGVIREMMIFPNQNGQRRDCIVFELPLATTR